MPSRFSVGEERGLANWPAMRPTCTTGDAAAYVRTTAICRNTRKKSRMLLAVWLIARCSVKLSAQSPPCRRNASPDATRPSACLRFLASPAKISGGKVASCCSTSASARASGYSGIWTTGLLRQLSGVQRSGIATSAIVKIRSQARASAEPGYTRAGTGRERVKAARTEVHGGDAGPGHDHPGARWLPVGGDRVHTGRAAARRRADQLGDGCTPQDLSRLRELPSGAGFCGPHL